MAMSTGLVDGSRRSASKRAMSPRCCAGGRVSFVQQKMLLPFYDIFDEQRYFEPARQQTLTALNGQPLAITICEDAWNDKGFWSRRLYPSTRLTS